MIFHPEMAKLIRQSRKSQTRRRIGDRPTCRYQPGKSYAVQPGRGQTATCRITITNIRTEPLGELTLRDALREGFKTRDEFYDHWRTLHRTINLNEPVWVITFTLGDTTDTPRLLAARTGGTHGDYVTNPHLAMEDEPEALTETETEHYGKIAHARHNTRLAEPLRVERDHLAAALQRLEDALETSPSRTISDSVRRLRRELQVLNRKLAA